MKKNILKISITTILTICTISLTAWIFHSKSWYHKMNEFYKYPGDYEVWYFGSSHTIMGTLPEEMYNEYGIRSYNLADYGQTLAIDYWITKNLIRKTKPKLVVLDVGQIGSEDKYSEANISYVRRMISSLPFEIEKINAINDLFEGDLWEEMLLPFSSDHYNWEYLTEDYFRLEDSYELGSDQNVFDQRGKEDYVLVTPVEIPDPLDIDNVNMKETLNSEYLRKTLALCKSNDIDVLLVKCPLSVDEETMQMYNQAFKIGQEYGFQYLNGFYMKESFDGDTDMWDAGHMNSLGARKWTHLLGKFIYEHYPQIEKSTNDEFMKKRWDNRYENYLKWLDTELPLQSYFYSFLMLCTNPRYSLVVHVKKGSPVIKDDIAMKLINQSSCKISYISGDTSVPDVSIIVKNEDEEIVDNAYFIHHSETNNVYERQGP